MSFKTTKQSGTASFLQPLAVAAGAATLFQPNPYIGPTAMNAQVQSAPTATANGIDERLLDAKIAVVEARTETKFAQLLGKMDVIGERISGLAADIAGARSDITKIDGHTRSARTAIITAILGTALALAAIAWGGVQIFQGGMSATASAYQSGLAASGVANDHAERGTGNGQTRSVHH